MWSKKYPIRIRTNVRKLNTNGGGGNGGATSSIGGSNNNNSGSGNSTKKVVVKPNTEKKTKENADPAEATDSSKVRGRHTVYVSFFLKTFF